MVRLRSFARCLALGLLSAFLLASCARLEGLRLKAASLPLAKALASKDLEPATRNLLGLCQDVAAHSAGRYGLSAAAASLRYLPGRADALAWKLTVAPPQSLKDAVTTYHSSRSSADKAAQAALSKGWTASIEAWDSIGFLGQRPSPLSDSLASLPMERIVEWVNRELFAASAPRSLEPSVRAAFAAFAAEVATADYLAARLTPASPVLGSYLSAKRDERTFAALYPDFLSRVSGLYAQKPLPTDWADRRDFLMRTWLQDYRLNYPNRFITNAYRDFGREGLSDAALASWQEIQPDHPGWQARYASAGSDLGRLLAGLKKP